MSVEGNAAALGALARSLAALASSPRPRAAAAEAANARLRRAHAGVTSDGVTIRTDNGRPAFLAPSVAEDMGAAIDRAMGEALGEVGR